MLRPKHLLIVFLLLCGGTRVHAQLVVNEVSQGPSGTKEYVELLVTGTPTCWTIPCVDLRGWYIDDNNGNHAAGSGTGIATGVIRFSQDPLWSCVPIGTLIVIYNDGDINAAVPAQDLSMSDGNCRLIIPVSNCTLLEKNTAQPSTANATYPTTGFTPCGTWNGLGMSNTDDSFQTINPTGSMIHAVSWGNNNLSTVIYFAGTSAGMVASMVNGTNPNLQANWVRTPCAGNETPGLPNSAANANWINSMNNGCTPVTPMTLAISNSGPSCGCSATATVTPSGGFTYAPYTYSWAPTGGNAATATGLCAGSYTCTVTDANGCSLTISTTIVSSSSMSTTASHTNATCFGSCNGTANMSVSGGTAPYTYSWAPSGGNAATATGLCFGNYTCTITDANGCTTTHSFAITQPLGVSSTGAQTNVSCNGNCNGSATVNASGGAGGYTYSWAPSGGTAATASSLCAGTYTCTITDANGCTATRSFNITQPAVVSATSTTTNVNCTGSCNGSATLTPSGGNGTYTYSWAPSGGSASTASSLCAGNYTCTITDGNGCTGSVSVAITQPPTALSSIGSSTNISCNGACNGSATVTPAGGTTSYSYSWLPSGGNAATASSLCPGTYTCTITDANGCTTTRSYTITQPPALTSTAASTNISCNGNCNGSATITPSGGSGTYSYTWSPSGGNAGTASSLCPGTYTSIATDVNGCTTTQSFNITQPPAFTSSAASINVTCNGNCNGSATITTSGGNGGNTYAWLPSGGNAATASSLCAGTYTATATDINGCTTTQSFSITQPSAITASAATTQATCGSNNGSITVTASGGTGVLTYAWLPSGGNAATANNLAAGTYTCTVTDASNCTFTVSAAVTNTGNVTASTTSSTGTSCFNTSDGSATAAGSGGSGTYTYAWTPSGGNAATAINLAAGSYTCTVTDANNCPATTTVTITSPSAITTSSVQTDVSCFSGTNGSATVTANGGTGTLTYNWTPSGGTAVTASNLAAGSYTCTVTDVNGCNTTQSITITEPSALTVSMSATSASCNGVCDGQAGATAGGGASPYTYSWSGGCNSASCTNLCAGTYTLTLTDANGCTLTDSSIVTEPTAISLSMSSTDAHCNLANGSATVTASGGAGGFSYAWLPSGGNTAMASSIAAGNYTVTVTDANGCNAQAQATINNLGGVSLQLTSSTNVSCFNLCDGSAGVTTTSGNGPFVYSWAPSGGNAATASSLCAGSYTCTVTDVDGCTALQSVTLTQPQAISLNVTNVTICNGQSTTLSATASGGTAPYTYAWSPSGPSVSPTVTTTYTVTATDASGCTSPVQTQTVTVNPPLTAIANNNGPVCSGNPVTLTGAATGGDGNYTYTWSPVTTPATGSSVSATPSSTTTYTLTVTDGCGTAAATNTSFVNVFASPVPSFTATPQEGCIPLCVNFTGTTPNASNCLWAFGDGGTDNSNCSPAYCYNAAGLFNVSLTVTDNNGCTGTLTMPNFIQAYPVPTAAFNYSPHDATILNPMISFSDASSGASSWLWDFGDGTGNTATQQNLQYSYEAVNCYPVSLTVSNIYGCTDVASNLVCVAEDVTLYVPNAFTPNSDGQNDGFLPKGSGLNPDHYELLVFDRWGNLMFKSHDISESWDGLYKGHPAQEDVYVWKVNVWDMTGKEHQLIGHVSLIR